MSEPQGKAYLVRKLDGWRGEATLYQLDPPYKTFHYKDRTFSHVVIMEHITKKDPNHTRETFFIPSDETGEQRGWFQMDHCLEGHDTAASLRSAGYRIVENE